MPPGGSSSRAESQPELLKELPQPFLRRMEELLGDEYPRLLDIYTQPPAAGLRLNTLKIAAQDFLSISPYALEPLPWAPAGYRLLEGSPAVPPGKHPYHAAGLYYLQDPSAMAVVELLNPQPGEAILDLSAAPGGKSTHILARLQNQGLLVANEVHPRRAWDLAENLERWGAHNAILLNEDPQRLAAHFGALFDRVLLDAPCSGEGMFRKSKPARLDWSPQLVQSCALRQQHILAQAARLVRPGGLLAYSTCTFSVEENELVIAQFLEAHAPYDSPAFEVVSAAPAGAFSTGRPEWIEPPIFAALAAQLRKTVRLLPHLGFPEGHFVALLRRIDDQPESLPPPWLPRLPADALQAWRHFCQENLSDPALLQLTHRLLLEGSYLYAVPAGTPSLGRLHTIHPGWWLGQVKGSRFEPSHALALGLNPAQAHRTVRLQPDAPALRAYLQGESLRLEGDDGWLLVCVAGAGIESAFPLGWGKRSNGIIKNKLPRGLRKN